MRAKLLVGVLLVLLGMGLLVAGATVLDKPITAHGADSVKSGPGLCSLWGCAIAVFGGYVIYRGVDDD